MKTLTVNPFATLSLDPTLTTPASSSEQSTLPVPVVAEAVAEEGLVAQRRPSAAEQRAGRARALAASQPIEAKLAEQVDGASPSPEALLEASRSGDPKQLAPLVALLLRSLGYDVSDPSSPEGQEAVRDVQRRAGRTPTGELDWETLLALLGLVDEQTRARRSGSPGRAAGGYAPGASGAGAAARGGGTRAPAGAQLARTGAATSTPAAGTTAAAPGVKVNTEHPTLKALANGPKVGAGVGLCVTGVLNTMQRNGIPNPPATGADVGNNPRGGAVQLMKSYGWTSLALPGAKKQMLNSPYGNVEANVIPAAEYKKLADAGQIPSGALVFQTRHDSWNGTSHKSRGYDMAIALNGGRGHHNFATSNSPLVYGNATKHVMVLVPKDAVQASPPPAAGVAGAGSPLRDLIAKGEGGYNSMNQGTRGGRIVGSTHNASSILGKDLTDMTVGEVMAHQRAGRLFAAGKYQIIPSTMQSIVGQAGVGSNDRFDAATQEKLGQALIHKKRPYVHQYLTGQHNDRQGAMLELAREWASLPDPRTGASYHWKSGNRSSHSVAEVAAALEAERANYTAV